MHWLLTNNKCPTCKEDYRGIKEEVDELDEERINFRNIFSSYLDFNNNIFFNDFNDDDNDNDNDSYNSYRPRSSFINNRGNWRGENGRGRGREDIGEEVEEEEIGEGEEEEEEILGEIIIELFIIIIEEILEDKEGLKEEEEIILIDMNLKEEGKEILIIFLI